MRVAAAVRVSALMMGMAGLAVGCSDVAPTGPDAPMPSLALATSSVDTVTVIQRVTPLSQDITVGAWINKTGGSLAIPEAGLKVTIPAGAVQKRTYFSVTAYAGNLVSYEFGPHGMRFRVPLQMHQDARDLNIWKQNGDLTPTVIPIEAGYFPSRDDIDMAHGTAKINEILPVDIDLLGSKIHFDVRHFSGYLLASGRN
jgi:hypothetical protein